MAAPFFFVFVMAISFWAGGAPAKSASSAKAPSRTVETFKDIIEKAYTLNLQKDRSHALLLLRQAIKKESSKGAVPEELLQALESVGSTFFTEKSQQTFEQALSLKKADPRQAQLRLAEALKAEPDHLLVQLEMVRVMVLLGDCAGAVDQAEQALANFEALEASQLALAQAAVCVGQYEKARTARKKASAKGGALAVYWGVVDFELAHKTESNASLTDILANNLKHDGDFPESYYWAWKLGELKYPGAHRAGQKYLSLCKSISARAYRNFSLEPQLCRRVVEVEASLKSASERNEL